MVFNPCSVCGNKHKSIFCNAELTSLNLLDKAKVCNLYTKNQQLFRQGDPVHGVFCITKGKVKLVRTGESGKESILRIASNGDIIGHRSFMSSQAYQASATALGDVEVCFIDKDTFDKMIHTDPSIALLLAEKLSESLGQAEKRLTRVSQLSVKDRTACFLLHLHRMYGVQEGERSFLDIHLSREEMASMVGTTPESMIRTLSGFNKEGLICLEGKKIYLLDHHKLSESCGLVD